LRCANCVTLCLGGGGASNPRVDRAGGSRCWSGGRDPCWYTATTAGTAPRRWPLTPSSTARLLARTGAVACGPRNTASPPASQPAAICFRPCPSSNFLAVGVAVNITAYSAAAAARRRGGGRWCRWRSCCWTRTTARCGASRRGLAPTRAPSIPPHLSAFCIHPLSQALAC
jgi:hypothetical protein